MPKQDGQATVARRAPQCSQSVASVAAAAPHIRVDEVAITSLGAGLYQVRAVVSNHGYLPTNLSDVAIENQVAKPTLLAISIEGGELIMNPRTVEVGHLAGRKR